MKRQNVSSVVEFILLGFSNFPELQRQLFQVFLVTYLRDSDRKCHHYSCHLIGTEPPCSHVSISPEPVCGGSRFQCKATMPEMLVVLSNEKIHDHFYRLFFTDVFHSSFGGTECFLLGAMAYDWFAAICHPLSYALIMNRRVFMKLIIFSWGLRDHSGYCADHNVGA